MLNVTYKMVSKQCDELELNEVKCFDCGGKTSNCIRCEILTVLVTGITRYSKARSELNCKMLSVCSVW